MEARAFSARSRPRISRDLSATAPDLPVCIMGINVPHKCPPVKRVDCGNYRGTLWFMAGKRRGAGRPAKPKGEQRTCYLRARLTEAQDAEIKAAADQAGISVSAWAVERLLRCARQE